MRLEELEQPLPQRAFHNRRRISRWARSRNHRPDRATAAASRIGHRSAGSPHFQPCSLGSAWCPLGRELVLLNHNRKATLLEAEGERGTLGSMSWSGSGPNARSALWTAAGDIQRPAAGIGHSGRSLTPRSPRLSRLEPSANHRACQLTPSHLSCTRVRACVPSGSDTGSCCSIF